MNAFRPPFATDVVVFDLDGVLVDSENVNVASAVEAFRRFGAELPARAAARIVGRHPIDYVPELARAAGLREEILPDLLRFQDGVYRAHWREHVRAIPGADDAVAGLRRRGFRLGLATSAGREHAEACLERFGWRDAFATIVTKDDVARRKPDPEVYVRALAGLAASRGVAVEDTAHGIAAARGAGMTVIAVLSGAVPATDLADADLVIEGMADLPGAVRRASPDGAG